MPHDRPLPFALRRRSPFCGGRKLFVGRGPVDLPRTRETCVRLFAYRQAQTWPPVVRAGDGWDALYADQAEGLGVLQSLEDAVAWANELIERIDRSR